MKKLTKIPDDVSVYLRYLHQDLAKAKPCLAGFQSIPRQAFTGMPISLLVVWWSKKDIRILDDHLNCLYVTNEQYYNKWRFYKTQWDTLPASMFACQLELAPVFQISVFIV